MEQKESNGLQLSSPSVRRNSGGVLDIEPMALWVQFDVLFLVQRKV